MRIPRPTLTTSLNCFSILIQHWLMCFCRLLSTVCSTRTTAGLPTRTTQSLPPVKSEQVWSGQVGCHQQPAKLEHGLGCIAQRVSKLCKPGTLKLYASTIHAPTLNRSHITAARSFERHGRRARRVPGAVANRLHRPIAIPAHT